MNKGEYRNLRTNQTPKYLEKGMRFGKLTVIEEAIQARKLAEVEKCKIYEAKNDY